MNNVYIIECCFQYQDNKYFAYSNEKDAYKDAFVLAETMLNSCQTSDDRIQFLTAEFREEKEKAEKSGDLFDMDEVLTIYNDWVDSIPNGNSYFEIFILKLSVHDMPSANKQPDAKDGFLYFMQWNSSQLQHESSKEDKE